MLRLFLFAVDINANEGNYTETEWFAPIMQFNDRFGFVVWPLLALLVVGFMVWGTVKSMSHKRIAGEERFKCKKEIIGELRRQLNGLTLEQICKLIRHDREMTSELLTEMIKDSMIAQHVNSKGATLFRLKGI